MDTLLMYLMVELLFPVMPYLIIISCMHVYSPPRFFSHLQHNASLIRCRIVLLLHTYIFLCILPVIILVQLYNAYCYMVACFNV